MKLAPTSNRGLVVPTPLTSGLWGDNTRDVLRDSSGNWSGLSIGDTNKDYNGIIVGKWSQHSSGLVGKHSSDPSGFIGEDHVAIWGEVAHELVVGARTTDLDLEEGVTRWRWQWWQ